MIGTGSRTTYNRHSSKILEESLSQLCNRYTSTVLSHHFIVLPILFSPTNSEHLWIMEKLIFARTVMDFIIWGCSIPSNTMSLFANFFSSFRYQSSKLVLRYLYPWACHYLQLLKTTKQWKLRTYKIIEYKPGNLYVLNLGAFL